MNGKQKDTQQIYITFLKVMEERASLSEFESSGGYKTKEKRNLIHGL